MRSIEEFKAHYPRNLRVSLAIASVLVFGLLPFVPVRISSPPPPTVPEFVVLFDPTVLETPFVREIERPRLPVVHFDETVFEIEDDTVPLPGDAGQPSASAEDPTIFAYDTAPRPVHMIRPDYPDLAREAELEGRVLLRVELDEDGLVDEVRVVESTTYIFESPTIEAVRKWVFTPARKGGRAVRASILFPIEYRLVYAG